VTFRTIRFVLGFVVPMVLVAGACSSSGKKAGNATGSNGSTASTAASNSKGTTPATAPGPPAAATKTSITTEDGNKYTVTVTPKAPDPKAPCANQAAAGRLSVPFTLEIHNDNDKDVPEPKLGVRAEDTGARDAVAAISVQGQCIDFTLVGNKILKGATATYQGSVSNVSPTGALSLNINNGSASQATSVPVPLFQKS
jgi:hypothetical protein